MRLQVVHVALKFGERVCDVCGFIRSKRVDDKYFSDEWYAFKPKKVDMLESPSFAVWDNVCLGQWVVPRHGGSRLASSENRSRTYVHLGTSRKFMRYAKRALYQLSYDPVMSRKRDIAVAPKK